MSILARSIAGQKKKGGRAERWPDRQTRREQEARDARETARACRACFDNVSLKSGLCDQSSCSDSVPQEGVPAGTPATESCLLGGRVQSNSTDVKMVHQKLSCWHLRERFHSRAVTNTSRQRLSVKVRPSARGHGTGSKERGNVRATDRGRQKMGRELRAGPPRTNQRSRAAKNGISCLSSREPSVLASVLCARQRRGGERATFCE